ncbi:MAG: hypothetical protein GY822_24660 [Deltaproteobacteria bacterium]|nr:hypothetical protein [Deltaproteobacteria bacterium]
MVVGDNRSNEEQHQAVVDAVLSEAVPLSFLMNSGDLVSSGDNEDNWDDYFRIERDMLNHLPVYVAIGNHEVDGRNWDIPERIFEFPIDVTLASNSESHYVVQYGNAQMIVINSEVDSLVRFGSYKSPQAEWLEEVFSQMPAGVEHRLPFIHKGPYSSKPGRSGNYWMRQWMDDFADGQVDVIFSGHDHYAERGWTESGVNYVIHGGGGAPLYETLGPRLTGDHTIVYGEARLGYALVQVDGGFLAVTLKGTRGEIVGYFEYGNTTSPQCMAASDCGAAPTYACNGGNWECRRNACQFSCDSSGFTLGCSLGGDDQCEEEMADTCEGTPRCESAGLLLKVCVCGDTQQCSADIDCDGRPPPILNCEGSWACVDDVCEFSPANGICARDILDAGPMVSSSDAGALLSDGGQSVALDAGSIPVGARPIQGHL